MSGGSKRLGDFKKTQEPAESFQELFSNGSLQENTPRSPRAPVFLKNEGFMEQVPDTFSGLFWGYAAIWALLSCFVIFLIVKLQKLEKRLEEKEKK